MTNWLDPWHKPGDREPSGDYKLVLVDLKNQYDPVVARYIVDDEWLVNTSIDGAATFHTNDEIERWMPIPNPIEDDEDAG